MLDIEIENLSRTHQIKTLCTGSCRAEEARQPLYLGFIIRGQTKFLSPAGIFAIVDQFWNKRERRVSPTQTIGMGKSADTGQLQASHIPEHLQNPGLAAGSGDIGVRVAIQHRRTGTIGEGVGLHTVIFDTTGH